MERLAVAAAFAAVLVACEADEVRQIRVLAAENFSCPPEQIEITMVKERDDGSVLYKASGCGETSRLFLCEGDREQVAGRDRGGARGNMRSVMRCRRGNQPAD